MIAMIETAFQTALLLCTLKKYHICKNSDHGEVGFNSGKLIPFYDKMYVSKNLEFDILLHVPALEYCCMLLECAAYHI